MQETTRPTEYSGDATTTSEGVSRPVFVLAMLCFVPSGAFYFFGQSGGAITSLAPGTILVCLIFLGMILIGRKDAISATRLANYTSLVAAVTGAIIVHFVGSVAVGSGTEPMRALQSLPLLMLLMGGSIALATLLRQTAASLNKAIALIRWALVGLTILAILGIQPPTIWEKSIFPFSEPSHLALVLNPFLMHACISNRGVSRGFWIAAGLAIAYVAQSLTMMAGMVLTSMICLPLIGIVAALTIAAASSAFVDLSYFVARLDFNPDTQNLSTLVYRQGWELVGDAMQRTSGWGVGFQQLGYAPFRSPSADVLYSILRDDANTRDGGFLLAKIVSEFGLVGWLMALAYLGVSSRAALLARRMAQRRAVTPPAQVAFAWCVICSFAVDMFVRDVGYFAGSVLLFLSSLYIIWEQRSFKIKLHPLN